MLLRPSASGLFPIKRLIPPLAVVRPHPAEGMTKWFLSWNGSMGAHKHKTNIVRQPTPVLHLSLNSQQPQPRQIGRNAKTVGRKTAEHPKQNPATAQPRGGRSCSEARIREVIIDKLKK